MGDYTTYKAYFENITNSHLTNFQDNRFEYLYELINVIIHWFTTKYYILRLVMALIVMGLWYKIYTYWQDENNKRYALTTLFILWSLNFGNIFIIRSTVAVSICVYSIRYIEGKNLKKFLLSVIIAMGFHTMSIIWAGAYFIFRKSAWKKFYYIILGLVVLFSNYMAKFVLEIASYLGERIYNSIYSYIMYGANQTFSVTYDNRFTTFKALLNIVFLLILFIYVVRRKEKMCTLQNEDRYLNLYLIGSIVYVIALNSSNALTRAALTYNSAQYFLLPRMFDLPEIRRNITIKFMTFMLFVTYLYMRMYMNINSNAYVPFTLI